MNKSALRYYDTKVYKNYFNKIEILKDTLKMHQSIVGIGVSIYIIDNNKKYFKKCYLHDSFFDPKSTDELNTCVEILIDNYIKGKIGYKIQNEINTELIEDWKKQ